MSVREEMRRKPGSPSGLEWEKPRLPNTQSSDSTPAEWVSLQFNWYTRRAVLAGIYNTTELVMMQDSSPDFEDTWRFLENRINDAMNMGHTAKQVVGD